MAGVPAPGARVVGEHAVDARRGHWASRLLLRLHRWAESGWAGRAIALWGVLQGSVVPGPSDALFLPLGLADPPKVARFAVVATIAATVGGCIAWLIGVHAFESVGLPLMRLLGMGAEELARSRELFERYGWMFVVASTLTPLSTKLVCIAAGAFGVPGPLFVTALLAGRGARFAALSVLVRVTGPALAARLGLPWGGATPDATRDATPGAPPAR